MKKTLEKHEERSQTLQMSEVSEAIWSESIFSSAHLTRFSHLKTLIFRVSLQHLRIAVICDRIISKFQMSTGHQPGLFKRPAKAHKTFKGKRSKGQIDQENRGIHGIHSVLTGQSLNSDGFQVGCRQFPRQFDQENGCCRKVSATSKLLSCERIKGMPSLNDDGALTESVLLPL